MLSVSALLVAGEEDGAERFMLVNGCLCVVVFVFLVGKFVCLMTVGLVWMVAWAMARGM